MSVLIKDMELPKDCPYCKMAYYNASDEFTGCAVIPGKRYAMHNDAVYAKSTQRPDWCPLVEIPEPKEGHWIPHESPDGGEQYECSECGVLWEFNDGTPEDNEAYFCPKCGARMKGVKHEAD